MATMAKRSNSEGRSSSMTEDRDDESVQNERKIFDEICKHLSHEQCHSFGLHLGLDVNALLDIERDADLHRHGREFTIVRLLEKWKEKVNPSEDQLVHLLVKSLRAIERNDVADTIEKRCLYENRNSLPELVKEAQVARKKSFRNLQLPRFLWMKKKRYPLDQLFVELTMKRKNEWGEEEENTVEKEEIFVETEFGIPRRILVEGQPGYGKTTLVTKYLSDWSRGENYISDRFDLVFVILLRNYEGNVSHHLLQQCRRVKGSDEEKLKAIEDMEERVLLLLDGLDEISTEVKESLVPLIAGEQRQRMTVVVTCRTGLVRMESKSDTNFGRMENDCGEFFIWDKRVEIKGISPGKRREFLQKYLNVDDEELKAKICHTNFKLSDLYECPLFLLLLAVLIQEKEIRPIETRTELYKTIFNFVINRGLEKLKGQTKEFDVFDLKRESDDFGCRLLLINFGRLCLEKIKTKNLIFEESELLECSGGNDEDEDLILKLGFLSKQISFFNYEEEEHYQPIHKSFLEFSAAFFLSSLDEILLKKEIQKLLLNFDIWPKKDQLLYPFLGGFLQSNAFQLFNILSPYNSLISVLDDSDYITPYNMESVLSEIPQTEEILKSLENFSIGNWKQVEYKKALHEWFVGLIKNSEKRSEDTLLEIPDQLDIINCLSISSNEEIEISSIRVEIGRNELEIKSKIIHCRNLTIDVIDFNRKTPRIIRDVLTKIKTEKIWLIVWFSTAESVNTLFKEITEEFNNLKFYYLILRDLTLLSFSTVSHLIGDLLRKKKLEFGLYIHFSDGKINDSFQKEFNSLAEDVFNSDLKSFSVDNSRLHVGSFAFSCPVKLFNGGSDMKLISVRGSLGEIKKEEMNEISVEHFHCPGFTSQNTRPLLELLLKCKNIKKLSCRIDLIADLGGCDSISGWKGLESIVWLALKMKPIESQELFLKGITLLKNVREIYFFQCEDVEILIKIILLLPSLKKICIFSSIAFLMQFLERFIIFKDEEKEKVLSFDELEVQWIINYRSSSLSSEFMKCLEKCLLTKVFVKFSILDDRGMNTKQFLKHFISKEEFNISSQLMKESPDNEFIGFNSNKKLLPVRILLLKTLTTVSLRNG